MPRKLSSSGEYLYKCLEIPKTSSNEEIKSAFSKLASKFHPDKNPDDPEAKSKFKEISLAHATLTDDTSRAIYDKYGNIGLQAAKSFGRDNFKQYFLSDEEDSSKCKCYCVLATLFFILSGCCYCCCYCGCCYCCFCFGKCDPDKKKSEPDYDPDAAVTSQPKEKQRF